MNVHTGDPITSYEAVAAQERIDGWKREFEKVQAKRDVYRERAEVAEARVAELTKQLENLSHNYRVSFNREEQLNEELNDLTMAIVHLFSPATARRIYSLRAEGAALGEKP